MSEQFSDITNDPEYKKWEETKNPKVVNKTSYDLLKYGLIALILFCAGLLYLIYSGYTKTEISCPSDNINLTCATCPTCPTLECPNNNNTCTCNFPSNLKINLVNSS